MASQTKPIIVTGPTASGKTTLGIQLAKQFSGAVISADSRMVYRRLDIGTGKPTWEHHELDARPWIVPQQSEFGPYYTIEGVDHYGLDLVEPETNFSLPDWLAFARGIIPYLQTKGIRPIIVGGTGLYIRGLVEGLVPPPTDPILRSKLEQQSLEDLRRAVAAIDPVTAKREQHNHRRLVRALEVFELTGKPISSPSLVEAVESIVMAPDIPLPELYARIDQRLRERIDQGLVEEVRALIALGISKDWLVGIGLEYRSVTQWLDGKSGNTDELFQELSGTIHAYARRQKTYLRTQIKATSVVALNEALLIIRESDAI